MKQTKIHVQEVQKCRKYIERSIQIVYFDLFSLQELLCREVGQANQHQDQRQRPRTNVFKVFDNDLVFLSACIVITFNAIVVEDKKALMAQLATRVWCKPSRKPPASAIKFLFECSATVFSCLIMTDNGNNLSRNLLNNPLKFLVHHSVVFLCSMAAGLMAEL